jgi:hypothetical protein
MYATLSTNWTMNGESFMRGLKLGGLLNQSIYNEDAYRQGRHHFMTAITQIMEFSLAFEQISASLKAADISYSFTTLNIAKFVVPIGVTYLASRQIEFLNISKIANHVQSQLGNLSLIATVTATVALFAFGQTVLAVTSMTYLTIGVLYRYNVLPERIQRIVQQSNFIIGNFTGLYFGGNFIRLICTLNLVIAAVEKYFKYKSETTEPKQVMTLEKEKNEIGADESLDEVSEDEPARDVSLDDLQRLSNVSFCSLRLSHIHKEIIPPIREDVRVDDILDLMDKIDWSLHEHVITAHLATDLRWLEVGRFNTTPIEYFKRNLRSLVASIRDHNILEGKPQNYEMLEKYIRYIAQELQNLDEMTQADILIVLGIEGGEYCGPGKFRVVEEIFGNLVSQANGLPLELRMLACLQQERLRVWQQIYRLIWQTNPIWQINGYMTGVDAVHNANILMNLFNAGSKFGIPCQAARNDQTAVINPLTHYSVFSFVNLIENSFWKGDAIPQCYVSIEKPEGRDQWKVWKWLRFHVEDAYPRPYDSEAALELFNNTIGTVQIPKSDIYSWWQEWVERKQELSDKQKEDLIDELTMMASLNGEPLEVNNQIQPKFLKAMLIEMGVFDKP